MSAQRTVNYSDIDRILLVRTDRIGDVLLSTPVAAAIKAVKPEMHVALLARNQTKIIGERNPSIDNVLTIDNPDGSKRPFTDITSLIRKEKYDCAVVLHPTLYLAVLLVFARVPLRAGTAYRFYSPLFNLRHPEHRKVSLKHEVEYNLGLLAPLNIPCSEPEFQFDIYDDDREGADQVLREINIEANDRFCVLQPGTGGSSMTWPPHFFAETGILLKEQFNIEPVVHWGPGEEDRARKVCDTGGGSVRMLPRVLTLSELAALLQKALFILGPDTGVLHLANSVGTRMICLYPPSWYMSSRRWGPYGIPESMIISDAPESSVRNLTEEAREKIMQRITPQMVVEAAGKIKIIDKMDNL
ncbi:glycosyltransferase family 9 protein [candidate division KSB1 bacterium]